MSKKQIVLLIVIAAIVTWILNLLIGNFLAAKLSTLPFARKLNLFNPQAPIVITNRETIRVDNGNDAVEVAESAKSKLSTIVYFDGDQLVTAGGAVNWTSDGYFMSTAAAFSTPGKVYAVITNNGDLYPVEKAYPDTASGLVLVQTAAKDLAVLDAAEVRDLRVGQQVVLLLHSTTKDALEFSSGYVQRLLRDTSGMRLEADSVSGLLQIQTQSNTLAGQAALNLSGRLLGVWTGTNVIPVDEMRVFANNFFADQKQVIRPRYGFSYQLLSETEAKALQTVAGAKVMTVAAGLEAASAGLKAGDVIVDVNGSQVTSTFDLDAVLRSVQPGQQVVLTVSRGGTSQSIVITAGTIK